MATLAKLNVILGLEDQLTNKLQKVGNSLGDVGRKMTLGLTTPLIGVGVAATKFASDLAESTSKAQNVFGQDFGRIEQFANGAAQALGLSKAEALEATGTMGNLFKGVGLGTSQAADFSTAMAQAAADLGSFNNVDPGQVLEDLRSGLVGEAEPLRKYGILLNEASVKAKGLELGLADANGELSEGAKVQARYALIMEQLGDAQGDFARTSGGLANQQRILKARLKDTMAEMGQRLIPIALKLASAFGKALDFFNSMPKSAQTIIMITAGLIAAIGPLLMAFGAIASGIAAVSAALPALGVAFGVLMGPLGLVLGALTLGAIAYQTNFLGIADATNEAVATVDRAVKDNIGTWQGWRNALIDAFDAGQSVETIARRLPQPMYGVAFALLSIADYLGDIKRAWDNGGAFLALQQAILGVDPLLDALAMSLALIAAEVMFQLNPAIAAAVFFLRPFFVTAVTFAAQKVDELRTEIGYLKDAFAAFSASVFIATVTAIARSFDDLKSAVGAFARGATERIGRALIGGLIGGMAARFKDVEKWLGGLGDRVKRSLPSTGDFIGFLGDHGKTLVQTFRSGIAQAFGEIAGGQNTVTSWLRDMPTKTKNVLPSTTEFFNHLVDHGKNLLAGFRTGMLFRFGELGGGADTVVAWLRDLPGKVTANSPGITLFASLLYGHGTELIRGLGNGAARYWSDYVGPWFSGLPGRILNAVPLAGLGSLLWDVGYMIVSGIAGGIYAGFDLIRQAVADAVNLIPGGIRDLLGISSPSRVTWALGEYVAAGLAGGMMAGSSDVMAASRAMAGAAIPALGAVSGGASGSGSYGRGGGFANYGTVYVEAQDPADFLAQSDSWARAGARS